VHAASERQDEVMIGEIAIGSSVVLQVRAKQSYLIPLFLQSLSFLLAATI